MKKNISCESNTPAGCGALLTTLPVVEVSRRPPVAKQKDRHPVGVRDVAKNICCEI